MWFETLTGFQEEDGSADGVAARFVVAGDRITSTVNGRKMRSGWFEIPTLAELRHRRNQLHPGGRRHRLALRLGEVVADVRDLHTDPANAGAFFQVASQFNTLEMVSPSVTPEQGIDRYEHDLTQGPACAVACGAGTIYRNYLVPLTTGPGQVIGQSADHQINCLTDLAAALGVDIEMRNGYALPSTAALGQVNAVLAGVDEQVRDQLMSQLRIGLQWNTEVTLNGAGHTVTQAYCSALPVAYSNHSENLWEPFARLVLDGAYEATLAAAELNADATGNRDVFLTLLGGGAFGNRTDWILAAITRATAIFAEADLNLAIVSHGSANPLLRPLLS